MNRIQSDDLSILAYKKIKSMILANELPPGTKIVQDKLAVELGISRTPLRSALQMLEAEYLIEYVPRGGVTVKKFSNSEILEVFECRSAMESIAFRLFTERASDQQIKNLAELFNPFVDNISIHYDAYKEADIHFHNYVMEHCGNSFLNRLFQKGNLMVYIDRIGLLRPPEETLQEHLDIIDAMKIRDLDEVEQLAKLHLIRSMDSIKAKAIEEENQMIDR